MLKSMTGYGVAQGKIGSKRFSVECKSVNHKFCEVNVRMSSRYGALEGRIVELAKSFFRRGRIDISIRDELIHASEQAAKIDLKLLKNYHQQLKLAAQSLKINPEVSLNTLLSLPQVIISEEEPDLEKLWQQLKPLLNNAFSALEKMRQKEGQAVGRFFIAQLKALEKQVQHIGKLVPLNIQEHQKKFKQRIAKLDPGVELDAQRLTQEFAYFVDRTDISEELQRLSHHMTHFNELISKKAETIGRKLDFLLQEMNREANTLSAKAQNAKISQAVVECKHCLEKMREQIQNVE